MRALPIVLIAIAVAWDWPYSDELATQFGKPGFGAEVQAVKEAAHRAQL